MKCEACNEEVFKLRVYVEITGHKSDNSLKDRLVCSDCHVNTMRILDTVYIFDEGVLDPKQAFFKGLREGLKLKNVKQS